MELIAIFWNKIFFFMRINVFVLQNVKPVLNFYCVLRYSIEVNSGASKICHFYFKHRGQSQIYTIRSGCIVMCYLFCHSQHGFVLLQHVCFWIDLTYVEIFFVKYFFLKIFLFFHKFRLKCKFSRLYNKFFCDEINCVENLALPTKFVRYAALKRHFWTKLLK
jgi:hypothetical protein